MSRKKNYKLYSASPAPKGSTLIEQFEHIRNQFVKQGQNAVSATIGTISVLNANSLSETKTTQAQEDQYVDLYHHIIENYNSVAFQKAVEENWWGVAPRIFRIAWDVMEKREQMTAAEQYQKLTDNAKHNLKIVEDYIWNLRTKRWLISNGKDNGTIYIPRTVRRADQDYYKERIHRRVLSRMATDDTLILQYAKIGNSSELAYNIFDFYKGVPACIEAEEGDSMTLRHGDGTREVIGFDKVEVPDLEFNEDDLPFINVAEHYARTCFGRR